MIKEFWKKLTGIKKIEEQLAAAEAVTASIEATLDKEEVVVKTPKEIATEKKEPWVAVLDTHVNKDNIRNGFFELDWNEYFIVQLKSSGYFGESDEAIVDTWFSELCRNVGSEEGVNMDRRGSGFVNVNNIGNGRSEAF